MADITWVNVADTAVKVGLGALIAGGFGALTVWLTHMKETKKEFEAKRRQLIEEVMISVDEFSREVSLFWALLMNGVYKKKKGELAQRDKEEIALKEREVFEKFNELNSSKSKLLLISEKDCHSSLSEYREVAADFFKLSSIHNDGLTQEALNEHKEKMQTRRDAFFERLSIAYKHHA